MTAFEPRYGKTFTLALAGMAVRALSRVVVALKNRRQIGTLAGLDDRALKDIGLMRSDVHAALSSSFLHDPSVQLVNVAGYKRHIETKAGNLTALDLNRLRRETPAVMDRPLAPPLKGLPC
jgi:uncharacterized protein YjiS (DUF1127 family)